MRHPMSSISPDLLALLREAKARPFDDDPRHVLADWLDDQGEAARAEFLRVEAEQRHLEYHDPRWRNLDLRSDRLLSENASRWLGPLLDAHISSVTGQHGL